MHDNDVVSAPLVGSVFPLKVNIEPIGGMHMADFDFEIVFFATGKFKVSKTDMVMIDRDNYAVTVDTNTTGPGELMADVIIRIPDAFTKDKWKTLKVKASTRILIGR